MLHIHLPVALDPERIASPNIVTKSPEPLQTPPFHQSQGREKQNRDVGARLPLRRAFLPPIVQSMK